jgi:hypothetical protein
MRPFDDLGIGSVTVGKVCGVGEVQYSMLGQLPRDLVQDRQATDTRVKEADQGGSVEERRIRSALWSRRRIHRSI